MPVSNCEWMAGVAACGAALGRRLDVPALVPFGWAMDWCDLFRSLRHELQCSSGHKSCALDAASLVLMYVAAHFYVFCMAEYLRERCFLVHCEQLSLGHDRIQWNSPSSATPTSRTTKQASSLTFNSAIRARLTALASLRQHVRLLVTQLCSLIEVSPTPADIFRSGPVVHLALIWL